MAAVSSPGERANAGSSAAWAGRYPDPAAASTQTSAITIANGSPSANAIAAAAVAVARAAAVSDSTRCRVARSASRVVQSPASAAGTKRKPTNPTATAPPTW